MSPDPKASKATGILPVAVNPSASSRPPPPASPRTPPFALDLLEEVADVLGDRAAYSVFHYAAVGEGRRLAETLGLRTITDAVGAVNRVLEQDARVAAETRSEVRIEVRPTDTTPTVKAVTLGLYEGILSHQRRRRWAGEVAPEEGVAFAVVLREGDA